MLQDEVFADAFGDAEELAAWLLPRGVPVASWGTGEANSVSQLLAEMHGGDCRLIGRANLTRRLVRAVELTVTFGELRLVEHHQRLADGRVRRRRRDYSLSEKLKPGERSVPGAQRALSEELGIADRLELVRLVGGPAVITKSAQSYPGLITRYRVDRFTCELPAYLVRGWYVEQRGGVETVFTWQPTDRSK
jgi:hypothetical protein